MTSLHASSSLGALVLALASAPLLADTSVATDTTAALATSTAGNITVTEDGTITLAGGNAISVDSDATVTIDGTVDLDDADGATAIAVAAGTNATVAVGEGGVIRVLEDYLPDDDDGDLVANETIARATGRYGIRVDGDASGSIVNEGTIRIDGQDSAGIVVAGDYTGSISNWGTITVLGENSTGIATAGIAGDLTVAGTVTAIGAGASGVSVAGDVTGTVTIQGTVSQATSYTDDDGGTTYLTRAALRTGAAAVSITGDVAGGIIVAVPPTDDDSKNDDEDADGIDDDDEGTGSVVAYGNGPAIQVGGATDITIGSVTGAGGTTSVAIDGSVAGNAYYSNTDAYGLVIGGQGGNVTLTDGIAVTGALRATTYDASATALLVNAGSTVQSLYNSGTIVANLSSPGEGSTTAIRDLSGTLATIENTGFITASGSSTDTRTAIDLSANTVGVTITQYLNDDDAETSADYLEDNEVDTDPTVYTRITGDILLGSGNDTLDASSGEIIGKTRFGAGDDVLKLSGNTAYSGNVYFGTGNATATLSDTASYAGTMDFAGETASLTIADAATYSGSFSRAVNLSVAVDGGTLTPDAATTVSLGTLTVGSGGALGVYIDGDDSSTIHATSATLADGAGITATVTDLADAEGTWTVLTADSLAVEGTLSPSLDLPFIFDGSVGSDAGNVYLTIARKDAAALGLRRSAAVAWDAVYAAAQNDDSLSASLLQVEDADTLQSQVGGLLPDHSGGVFETVSRGDRLVSRRISEESSRFDITDVGGWLEPVMWRSRRDAGDAAGYRSSGWGLSGGVERRTALGYFGVSYAWLQGSVTNNGGTGKLDLGQHDLGLFWRTSRGPLMAWARLGGSRISVDSSRTFTGTVDDADFSYDATGSWKGWLVSGTAGAAYRHDITRRFSLRPRIEVEQMWLREDGYAETADSDAIALSVAKRTSRSLVATPSLSAAYSLGTISPDWRPLTFQLEAGRREVLSGKAGSTTAWFSGGDSHDPGSAFTITPDRLKGAWVGEASVLAGGYDFTWKISTRYGRTADNTDLSARASLSVAF